MDQRHTQIDVDLSVDEIALHWLSRRMSGSMSAEERREFESWRDAAPENKEALSEAEALLSRVDSIGDEVLAREFERELCALAARRDSRQSWFAALAATLAAILFVGVIGVYTGGVSRDRPALAYETSIGEEQKVTLADGSLVELNTSSRIEVDYSQSMRAVALSSGEVFFNVEKDAARPFVVKTKLAAITVTGTSFNVSTFDDRSVIYVLTGVVDVKPKNGGSATLLAGDAISIEKDGVSGPVRRFDPGLVFAWRKGKARFRDAPLGEVVQSLNRYFTTPIMLADPELEKLSVTGEFDIRDRDTAVAALKLIFNLDGTDEPARTVLRKGEHE